MCFYLQSKTFQKRICFVRWEITAHNNLITELALRHKWGGMRVFAWRKVVFSHWKQDRRKWQQYRWGTEFYWCSGRKRTVPVVPALVWGSLIHCVIALPLFALLQLSVQICSRHIAECKWSIGKESLGSVSLANCPSLIPFGICCKGNAGLKA